MYFRKEEMKTRFLSVLCGFVAPLACFASNEGVPSYYQDNSSINANRAGYANYQNQGYTKYVGNTGKKQVLSSQTYSYQVPVATPQISQNMPRGTMTNNGITGIGNNSKTSIYAGYARRFADFEFTTGVNSVLEWDDMLFNEINVGAKHLLDLRGFELMAYADYRRGEMSDGGLSMDYDLEPYDYAYPLDGIFTVSVGGQSGKTDRLKFGVGIHHIWDIAGWKITPHIGYEIFKHDLQMNDHVYPNPGVYLPMMTNTNSYVFGDLEGNYYAIPQDVLVGEESGLYQICMGPEDIKLVQASTAEGGLGTTLFMVDYTDNLGTIPWGVEPGECVVIGGDGIVKVSGTTHIYNTTWSGFYLGLEFEKQMTLADKLRFYVQVSVPQYSSEGIWPNRDDWQQNPSFLDKGDNGAFAYSAEMEYNYQLSDRIALSLKADMDYFHVGKIPGELYVAETSYFVEDEENPGNYKIVTEEPYTEYVSESLREATWKSFGLHFGLRYAF